MREYLIRINQTHTESRLVKVEASCAAEACAKVRETVGLDQTEALQHAESPQLSSSLGIWAEFSAIPTERGFAETAARIEEFRRSEPGNPES